jgi:hypothetical protein
MIDAPEAFVTDNIANRSLERTMPLGLQVAVLAGLSDVGSGLVRLLNRFLR